MLKATERILHHLEQHRIDWLILLGDLLNHGPRNPLSEEYQPAAVAERLNQYADQIMAVQGNCDSEVDQMLLKFPIMAGWQQVLLQNCRLFLTHGHHYHPENRHPLKQGDVLVYGHTHLPQAEWLEGIACFNPGSASLPKGGNRPSFGMLAQNKLLILALYDEEVMAELDLQSQIDTLLH